MSENKDETLASFQNITGIDDVGEAFSHLEAVNWNLMDALSRVMPHDDAPLSNTVLAPQPALPNPVQPGAQSNTNGFRPPSYDELPGPSNASASSFFASAMHNHNQNQRHRYPTSHLLAQLTSSINLDPSSQNNNQNVMNFNINFNQTLFQIRLPSTATIDQLKRKIFDVTNVPVCRQSICGWPPAKASDAQKGGTQICNLDLSPENELILIDLTEDGFMDTEPDEVPQRLDKDYNIKILYEPHGTFTLNLSGRTTILEVKTNVYYVKEIPVRHQEWTGWPSGCNNDTTLAESGIELNHQFVLRNLAERAQSNSNAALDGENPQTISNSASNTFDVVTLDSESSADEFEDATDFNTAEYIFTDSPPVQPLNRHLIPNNTDDETTGSSQFVENYQSRFGEPYPEFFVGSLESALQLACHKPAKERKLLAIYLHHGESILTNVFCDHLMKAESIIQTLKEKFVLFGWDMTYDSNKDMFLSLLTARISSNASLTARNIKLDKLPAIMLVGKSRQLGSNCEVLSVIHGNIGLDDLLSRLIETTAMYEEQLQVEIRQEDERAARDQVKAEQDMAYEETLQADMAKEAAKSQKAAAQAAERKRIESERAEENARRESIRLVAEQSLPLEPGEQEASICKIRVRKPTGDFLERRFYTQNNLQDLLNYVTANGFLIEEYKLISSWPRRDLTAIESSQTLATLKMSPQETVILEER
ncbi:FAS-associated factor 1 isoform X1 [Drosophila guanche]|uniref:Blast:FAS-associated factor 1 n=1 Tax=Drosophila guanche TaxID=7266 RepID=A0A3B0J074_DROGU|nr:FAS-associated factor 1 isoform X1 [Drosophila guanche]SPP73937.1 blast:FAS-associated factor 1 [Drosophila guanche]